MKYLLQLFFYSFLVSTIFAQNNTISIEWANSNNLAISKSQININGASSFFVDESNFTEQLITSWAKGVDSYIGANATNIRLETISSNSLGGIDKVSLPRLFEVSVVSKLARNKSLEVLSFNPLVNQNGIIKRIVSFDLKKNNNSRRSAKNFTVPNRTSSVLASGQWKRFEIDKTGVYKVTAQFLESIGLNLNGVNPETIKIYGTGGKPLPYINGENRFYDIPEVPVKVVGAGDGVFSGSDYLLFYGIGVQGYDKDNDTNLNPFSNEAYYYVTTGGSVQKKIGAIVEPSAAANTIFTDYDFENIQ